MNFDLCYGCTHYENEVSAHTCIKTYDIATAKQLLYKHIQEHKNTSSTYVISRTIDPWNSIAGLRTTSYINEVVLKIKNTILDYSRAYVMCKKGFFAECHIYDLESHKRYIITVPYDPFVFYEDFKLKIIYEMQNSENMVYSNTEILSLYRKDNKCIPCSSELCYDLYPALDTIPLKTNTIILTFFVNSNIQSTSVTDVRINT